MPIPCHVSAWPVALSLASLLTTMIVYPLESWLKLDRTQQNKLVSDHFPLDAKKKKKPESGKSMGVTKMLALYKETRHYEVLPERLTFSCTSVFLLPAQERVENRFKMLAKQSCESVALILSWRRSQEPQRCRSHCLC